MPFTEEQKEMCGCRHPRSAHPKTPERGFLDWFASISTDVPDTHRDGSCRMKHCDCKSFHKRGDE